MAKTGPKPLLDKQLLGLLKEEIINGMDLKNCAINVFPKIERFKNLEGKEKERELRNFTQQLYNWKCGNLLNLATLIETWRLDRKLMLANNNIEEFLTMDTGVNKVIKDEDGEETIIVLTDPQLIRVKADMSKFVAETIGKSNYSKRTELTGKNGADLIPSKEQKDLADNAINDFLNEHPGNTK